MKFTLDLCLATGDTTLDVAQLLQELPEHRAKLSDIEHLEGCVAMRCNGQALGEPYAEPLLRLVDLWLRKLPWVMGGDTETVALSNSEHCFAFVPAAGSVEISYFVGSEAEVEEYLIEPMTLRLEAFVQQSLQLGERLVQLIRALDADRLQSSEACVDLLTSLREAQKAWHDYQVHQRR